MTYTWDGKKYHYTFKWDGRQHPLPSRDSQKQRVYRAERVAFGTFFHVRQLGTDIPTIQLLVDGITTSQFWRRLRARAGGTPQKVTVRQGRPGATARGGYSRVTLPDWAKTVPVLLHELAHSATPGAAHHWPFCAAFLELVRHYMGQRHHDRLRASFRAHGVRFRPKRRVSRNLLVAAEPQDL